jgi:uncharacterized protein YjaG (DUF416 family)
MVYELPISLLHTSPIDYNYMSMIRIFPKAADQVEKATLKVYERLTNLSHELLHITHISTNIRNIFNEFEHFQKAINPIDDYQTSSAPKPFQTEKIN